MIATLLTLLISFSGDATYLVLSNGKVVETASGYQLTDTLVTFHDRRGNLLQLPRDRVDLAETKAYNERKAAKRDAGLILEAMSGSDKPKDMADLLELNPKEPEGEEHAKTAPVAPGALLGTWRLAGSEDTLQFSEEQIVFNLVRNGQKQEITASWRLEGNQILLTDYPARDPRDPPVKLAKVVSVEDDTLVLQNTKGTHRYYR